MAGSSKAPPAAMLQMLRPDAAGIDVGATEIFVAVPADRDAQPVRSFLTFTPDLGKMADWLERCGIQTIAMESTGVYWIPVTQVLEQRGFDVWLVDAAEMKKVPGRKSDVEDCQWIQFVHSLGLLRACFRPPKEIDSLRSLRRHRETLVESASQQMLHMQKALDQMNVQIHHVLSDLTGVSGMAIMDAILGGERDPLRLARLRHPRARTSEEVICKALQGNWRTEHLFALRQSLDTYRHFQKLIAEVDKELEREMLRLSTHDDSRTDPPKSNKKTPPKAQHNAPKFDVRKEAYRIAGVDLTEVPGISTATAFTILSETGPNLDRFPSASAFASWTTLCPNHRISGGKVLSRHTRTGKNRVGMALRLGAQALHHEKGYLGNQFRRLKARLGAPKAITAMAHKLSRIVFHLLTTKQPYDETIFHRQEQALALRREHALRRAAAQLGYQLIALPA